MTSRLIEDWLPIAELGVESLRERTPMTPYPAPNRLHVWWARRPLVAARAAVLASLLPADADRRKFLRVLGIHGDAVKGRALVKKAVRTGERVKDPYGYPRAFGYVPNAAERQWVVSETSRLGLERPTVLDPTAGGGSIPLESARLGFPTLANDLNPVAATILRATVEWPLHHGERVLTQFSELGRLWRTKLQERTAGLFPACPVPQGTDATYLWARTIRCPYCEGVVPLAPNWRLERGRAGVRLRPKHRPRECDFEIVDGSTEPSAGTMTGGDAKCPWPDCGRVTESDEIKRQAQAGNMGDQLFAVVYRRPVSARGKSGRKREILERAYRAPTPEDDNLATVMTQLREKLPDWEALDIIPTEAYPTDANDPRPILYGMPRWRDMFSPRQLLCHGLEIEAFREVAALARRDTAGSHEVIDAALVYLAIAIDRMLDWNSRQCTWEVGKLRMAHSFHVHAFPFMASFAEMQTTSAGLGYDWTLAQTDSCLRELIEFSHPPKTGKKRRSAGRLIDQMESAAVNGASSDCPSSPVAVTCQSADSLAGTADCSVDCIVIDPPYYNNVMYADLSDFFYVWLKRTAGTLLPEFFRRQLTDKENEAVANVAKFDGQKNATALAARDYQQRMAAIFAECRRVLKADGILTLMFTHKATGAWDALTTGLMEAGFTITASWPVNTEAEGSLHIKDKSAANSTIFLVCRPRPQRVEGDVAMYWEDVEPLVATAVRERVGQHQAAGVTGVDLYLSCFGPALEEFAKHWPLRRGQPRPEALKKKRGQEVLFAEPVDPYAVTPEDALDAARREVKRWRLEQILRTKRQSDLDPLTEWFVLAWDAFKAPVFPYDEALRLARVVGLDLDAQVVGSVAEKKASDLVLWDSAKRVAKGASGPADGSRAAIDTLHHVAYRVRQQGLQAGRDFVERNGFDKEQAFLTALTAVLEVLPVSKTFTKVEDEKGPVAEAASDFDALEHLRRLIFTDQIAEPQQLRFWTEGKA